jgi:hypothetical protein
VIIQDHIYQFLEDVLPYWKFSVRLSKDDIPNLPDLLRSISEEQIHSLQVIECSKHWCVPAVDVPALHATMHAACFRSNAHRVTHAVPGGDVQVPPGLHMG